MARLRLQADRGEWFGKPALEISVFAEGTEQVTRRFEAANLGTEQALVTHKQGLAELVAIKKELATLEVTARKAGIVFLYADPADVRRALLLKKAGFYKPAQNYFWVKYLGGVR